MWARQRFDPIACQEDLAGLLDKSEAFLEASAVPAAAAHRMMLAIDEVVSNALKAQGFAGPVRLTLRRSNASVSAVVADRGPPFNPLEAEGPDTEQDLESRVEGGLGILLLRRLMDRITYRRHHNCNILVFTVNLS